MPEKFRRYFLKDRETKSIIDRLSERLRINLRQSFKDKFSIELIETDFFEIYLINGRPLLAKIEDNVFPTLFFGEFSALAPKVVVDMGAVPHVCSGANIMAPGIVRFLGEFRKGDLVLVVDERHGKSIAIGEVLHDINVAKKTSQGIVAKNIHYVGDEVWNFIKKLEG